VLLFSQRQGNKLNESGVKNGSKKYYIMTTAVLFHDSGLLLLALKGNSSERNWPRNMSARNQCPLCLATFSTFGNRNKHQKKCNSGSPEILSTTNTPTTTTTSTTSTTTATTKAPATATTTTTTTTTTTFPEEYDPNGEALAIWVAIQKEESNNNGNSSALRTKNWSNKASRTKVLKTWPHFKNLILGKKANSFERLSFTEQDAIKQRNVASKHVGQGSNNYITVLGQFYFFVHAHEKHLLLEGSYDLFAAFPRIQAFLKFLQIWGYKAATIRNKAALLKTCMKHLQSLPRFAPNTFSYTRLVTAMQTCERWRSNMRASSVIERSLDSNEEKLRAEGKFFKPPEDLAFFRWLIRKVKKQQKIYFLLSFFLFID
jgi:hypothetical protein